jgi:6-phosphofructokinase 1
MSSYIPSPSSVINQKSIGILTSGGDAQGMNAAVRAVVRRTISLGHRIFAIMNGYTGMVENNIKQLIWEDVRGVISEGGTFIGTARCAAFMKREGRKLAVKNLLSRQIDRLVVIGGDGSLTGAYCLSQEWLELVTEVVKDQQEERKKTIQSEQELKKKELEDTEFIKIHSHLTVVGMVGSIDNDMCGTEMTIGAATALTRIMDAVDCISSTAASHQRDFIVEVMGRNCGWLALMGALATGADWVMIPEFPQPSNWRDKLWEAIKKGKIMGKRSSIVLVAEGAKDENGNPLKSDIVKSALDSKGCEARVTILGHVQRGGSPVAYDRNMSTMVGCKAAEVALSEDCLEACFVGILDNRVSVSPLGKCLEENHSIEKAINSGDYQKAMSLRSKMFSVTYEAVRILTSVDLSPSFPENHKSLKIAILHVGACSPGMNATVRAVVRFGVMKGHRMFGIRNGFEGLLTGDIFEMNWMSVNGWSRQGGATLGIRRQDPSKLNFEAVVNSLEKYSIQAVVMIGGWDGYNSFLHLNKCKEKFPILQKIPIILVPASISNNLPFSENSIGDDTSLNNIVEALDKIKQSAVSSNRVFVVEVMGSGYLALMASMSCGAEIFYLPEDPPTLLSLQRDINALLYAFEHHQQKGLVVNNEDSNSVFDTQTLAKLFESHSKGMFSSRSAILGHLQQGGAPSALDRVLAVMLSYHCIKFLEQESQKDSCTPSAIGVVKGSITFTPLDQVEAQMDFKNRRPKEPQWWMNIRDIQKIYGLTYPEDKKK